MLLWGHSPFYSALPYPSRPKQNQSKRDSVAAGHPLPKLVPTVIGKPFGGITWATGKEAEPFKPLLARSRKPSRAHRLFAANETRTEVVQTNRYRYSDGRSNRKKWNYNIEEHSKPDGFAHPASESMRGLALENGSAAWLITTLQTNQFSPFEMYRRPTKSDVNGEVIVCKKKDEVLESGKKDDRIDGKKGNDTVYGNNGDDALFGSKGRDQLYGSNGDDCLDGESSDDILE